MNNAMGGLFGKENLAEKGHAILLAKEIVEDLNSVGMIGQEKYDIAQEVLKQAQEIIRQSRTMAAERILGAE